MATIDVVKSSMLDAIIDTFTENKVNKMIRIIRISSSSSIRKCISPETTTTLSCVCIKTISKHGSRGQKNCRRYECTLPLAFITIAVASCTQFTTSNCLEHAVTNTKEKVLLVFC